MSQEVQVLLCYSCRTYQTQIVKKTSKWVCKLCNEKQVVKKVLGQGTGMDCREHCQRLNALRETKQEEEKVISLSLYDLDNTPIHPEERDIKSMSSQPENSKWNKYLSQVYTSEVDEEEQNDICVSQLYFPTSTPISIDIPSPEKSRNNSGQVISNLSSDFFMDTDDSLFVGIPEHCDALRKNVNDGVCDEKRKATGSIDPKKQEIKLLHSVSVEQGVSIQSMQRSIKNAEQFKNSNVKSFKIINPDLCGTSAVFKMLPSDRFVIEHFKKRVSLLEDIDKFTTDELSEMCKF